MAAETTEIRPYPSSPAKIFVRGRSLGGYAEPLDSQGMKGTVVPHVGPAGSFGSTPQAAQPSAIGVITIQDPDDENPFGGIKQLAPLVRNVTEAERESALKEAQAMTNDPIQAGVMMFEILAKRSKAAAAPPEPVPQPMPTMTPSPGPMVTLPPGPPSSPPMPAASQEQWLTLMAQMAATMGLTAPQPAQLPAAPPLPPAPAAVPLPPPATVQAPLPGLAEALAIPLLDFQPKKPSAKVVFHLGQYGDHATFYHWVLVEETAVYLVMDSRYEGPSYSPPKLGAKLPIKITLQNTQDGPVSYNCFSVGLQFTFGIFTIIVLLKQTEA